MLGMILLAACDRPRSDPPHQAAEKQPEHVRIAMFYASPAMPAENEKTQLCYSVENATAVHLDPPVDRIWPSPNHCFEVPTRKATYKLTAERGDEKVSQSVNIQPIPPKVMLFNISVSKAEVNPGETVSVCFNAMNSVRASIKPGVWIDPHGPSLGCVKDQPKQDTTYVITATGAGGDSATEKIAVHVKQ